MSKIEQKLADLRKRINTLDRNIHFAYNMQNFNYIKEASECRKENMKRYNFLLKEKSK